MASPAHRLHTAEFSRLFCNFNFLRPKQDSGALLRWTERVHGFNSLRVLLSCAFLRKWDKWER